MQCGICGFAQPGEANSCPSCGRGAARLIIYAASFFGLARLLAPPYSSYLDAEQERLESSLLRQNMEHRAALYAAAEELDAPVERSAP